MARGRFGGGEGVYDNPYLIEDSYDLHAIRLFPDKHFKLVYDINLGHTPFTSGKGWKPIPNFSGELDGNGKTIYNLYINRPDEENVGLFANYLNGARVYDVSFQNVNIFGGNYTGTVFGNIINTVTDLTNNSPAAIERVFVSGRIKAFGNYTGGVTGYLHWTNGNQVDTSASGVAYTWEAIRNVITDLYIEANVDEPYIAGLVGAIEPKTVNNRWDSGRQHYLVCNISNAVNNGIFTLVGNVYGRRNPIANYLGVANGRTHENFYFNIDTWRSNLRKEVNDETGEESYVEINYTDNSNKLNRDEMKDYENFGSLVDETMENGVKVWRFDFSKNAFPKFYFSGSSLVFVQFDDGGLYVYENDSWVKKFDYIPDIDEAEIYGMDKIEDVPASAWEELKTLSVSPKLINITKKQSSYYTGKREVKATNMRNFTTNNKKYYKLTVSFFDYADGIFNIETTK